MKRKIVNMLIAGVVASAMMAAGCVSAFADETEAVTEAAAEEAAEEEEEEDYTTGDASLDKVRNEDGIGENELLVLSFGTSYNDSRRLTIGAIEQALEDAFPDYSVRRGFTANIVIDHVERRDGIHIDDINEFTLKEALELVNLKRNVMIERGLLQAQKFSWSKCVNETIKVYNELNI